MAMFWRCVPLIYSGIVTSQMAGLVDIVLFLKPASSYHDHHSQYTELEFSLVKEIVT